MTEAETKRWDLEVCSLSVKRSALSVGRSAPRSVARIVVRLLLLATLAPWLAAAELPPETVAAIDRLFARWDKPDTPGAIVAIARGGETVFARGFGMANLEHGIPLTADTLSETGSVAKQFTASAVTLLAVRSQLSLDDSLKKHLPEVPDFGRDITLRMLLDHTSGIRDMHGLFDLLGRPTYTTPHENAEVLELVCRQRDLNFPPGTEYVYSNTGYLLISFVIERVSGRPFAEFCRDEVFIPRGMMRTAWRTQFNKIVPGRASAYTMEAPGVFRTDLPYSNIHGNGGLLTTVGDLLRWNESFERAEGEWAEVVRLMQTPSKLKSGDPIENGLGLRIARHRGLEEISHSGATAGYSTYLTRFPSERLSIAVLGNLSGLDGGAYAYRIADTLLGPALAPPEPRPTRIALSADQLATHAGLFHNAGHDLLVRTAMNDGKLTMNGVEVAPIAPHTFLSLATGARLVFSPVRDGQPQRLTFTSNRIARSYAAVPSAKPTAAQLTEYAGDYHCPELDVAIPVTVRDGALSMRIRPAPAMSAEPTFADGFWLGRAWHVTFARDAEGRVNGFEATSANGRCRRVKFVRRQE